MGCEPEGRRGDHRRAANKRGRSARPDRRDGVEHQQQVSQNENVCDCAQFSNIDAPTGPESQDALLVESKGQPQAVSENRAWSMTRTRVHEKLKR
jgi:hypothetical protein